MSKRTNDKCASGRPAATAIDVTDPSVLRIDMVAGEGALAGWVHTHGLEAFGLPELEIRGVPHLFLLPSAAAILSEIADYMLNGDKPVAAGDAMVLDDVTFLRVCHAEPLPGQADHYRHERWTVQDVPHAFCQLCGLPHGCDRFELCDPADPEEQPN